MGGLGQGGGSGAALFRALNWGNVVGVGGHCDGTGCLVAGSRQQPRRGAAGGCCGGRGWVQPWGDTEALCHGVSW